MGKVWLETTDGRLIHLPVQGNDVNTPDDTIRIPTSYVIGVIGTNRCYSQPIIVNHPTYGQFTIDLMQDCGKTGSCNQCGQCCTHPVADCLDPSICSWPYRSDIDAHACQYLVIDNIHKWGQKNNSSCSIYNDILNIFKGCAYPPRTIKSHMTNCGYSII